MSPLDAESMQYFGFYWDGEYFVWSTLGIGWCPSPLVHNTLWTAVAQHLREKGVPTLAWIDDFHITNFRMTKEECQEQQAKAARAAVRLALCVFYRVGCFMSVKKYVLVPATRMVYLGIACHSDLRQFELPEDKLAKLQAINTVDLEAGMITFAMFEKLPAKCTSMTVAMPAATVCTCFTCISRSASSKAGG